MSVVHVVGVNHRSAPLALREALAVSADMAADYLARLKKRCQAQEAAALFTCNRAEIYCLSDAPEKIVGWLADAAGGQSGNARFYKYREREAIAHLFRVASGLDSQLVGEPEITGQVRQFAALAREAGASGVVINRLMERALAAAAEARATTDIGRHSLSYPGLAARAAASIFPDLRETAVLFVGAGDMARAGLPIFRDRGARRLVVAARDAEKARAVAAPFGGDGAALAGLPDMLADFDVVISATASQVPIIGKGAVESALRRRRRKPMMFADLAVPRDLEEEIQGLPDVFVYHIDQFGDMAEDGRERRQAAAELAEGVIARHVEEFQRWRRERAAVPRVLAFRAGAAQTGAAEAARAKARLARGESAEKVVDDLARRLTAKLSHLPTKELLRQEGGADDAGGAGDGDGAGGGEKT